MRFARKIRICFRTAAMLLLGLCLNGIPAQAADRLQPVGENVVVVIDPGHGGGNLGTESGHTMEKVMTLVTAKAMFRELEQFDHVTVYLTHSDDRDMTLEERAEFAASVNADFLFSIHYNASTNHNMFGSEVWVSCETPYNAYGYQFGYTHLQAMRERGVFVRGVKTRISEGKEHYGKDYYGVIRECADRSVPALIIEHCYVDEERDAEYVEDKEGWEKFGRMDALSVAKYFGLKSEALGVDYSGEASKLQPANAGSRVPSTLQDETDPDICLIELQDCDYATGKVVLTVSAADYDSPLVYYDYSLDGGQNWSRWETWPGVDTLTGAYTDTFQLDLQIPQGAQPDIILRAYNKADLNTESNVLHFDRAFLYDEAGAEGGEHEDSGEGGNGTEDAAEENPVPVTDPPDHSRKSIGTTTFMPAGSSSVTEDDSTIGILGFLKLCLILVIILFFAVLVSQVITYSRRKKRRRNNKF